MCFCTVHVTTYTYYTFFLTFLFCVGSLQASLLIKRQITRQFNNSDLIIITLRDYLSLLENESNVSEMTQLGIFYSPNDQVLCPSSSTS